MAENTTSLSAGDQRQIVALIAQRAAQAEAPEELMLFDEMADEFFAAPDAVTRGKGRDESVGFGLDLALVTPYLLAMATAAVAAVGTMVRDAVTEQGSEALGAAIRRLLRIGGDQPSVTPLTDAQARQLRKVALDRGRALGLDDGRAAVLADAVVGGMLVGP